MLYKSTFTFSLSLPYRRWSCIDKFIAAIPVSDTLLCLLVKLKTLKIMPQSCGMLPSGLWPSGNIPQLWGIIFQCWPWHQSIFVYCWPGNMYRRGARRWRKLYRVNGHLFQAKRFSRVSQTVLLCHRHIHCMAKASEVLTSCFMQNANNKSHSEVCMRTVRDNFGHYHPTSWWWPEQDGDTGTFGAAASCIMIDLSPTIINVSDILVLQKHLEIYVFMQ